MLIDQPYLKQIPPEARPRAILGAFDTLGRFFRLPSVVKALEEDYWLDWVDGLWRQPGVLENEDALWDQFREKAPEWMERVAKFIDDPGLTVGMPEATAIWRLRVRRAAVRSILATGFGRQTFVAESSAGGAIYIERQIPGGAQPLRIGRVRTCTWLSGTAAERTAEQALTADNIALVERWLGVAATTADGARTAPVLEQLRAFARSSMWPLIPIGVLQPKPMPAGFGIRISEAELASLGVQEASACRWVSTWSATPLREWMALLACDFPPNLSEWHLGRFPLVD
jgi:hypothetical protein